MLNTCCISSCNSYNLGCVSTCPPLRIGYAAQAGDYMLRMQFGNQFFYTQSTLQTGDNISFDIKGANESATYVADVIRPDGTVMKFLHDGVCYESFTFTTKPTICTQNPLINFLAC